MSILTKIKLRSRGDYTEVMTLVAHPMESGPAIENLNTKRDKAEPDELAKSGGSEPKTTKRRPPAHYIEQLMFELNDAVVAEVSMGPAVAKSPMTSIALEDVKTGDKITVRWVDNKGVSGTAAVIA